MAAPNEFRWLDRNGDGILTRYEVAGSQPSLDTYDEFNNLDFNRNGRLERAEWHWSNVSFQQRDTNRDGIMSRAEFESVGRRAGDDRRAGGQANSQTFRVNSQQRWTDTGIERARGRRHHVPVERPDPDERQRAGPRLAGRIAEPPHGA